MKIWKLQIPYSGYLFELQKGYIAFAFMSANWKTAGERESMRHREILLLILPVIILLWLVGWSLYLIGPPDKTRR